jgi:hypothetical protein
MDRSAGEEGRDYSKGTISVIQLTADEKTQPSVRRSLRAKRYAPWTLARQLVGVVSRKALIIIVALHTNRSRERRMGILRLAWALVALALCGSAMGAPAAARRRKKIELLAE